ncbi:hypothetical protein [Conexibacter sp. SYSU D00693]|uniref:hypothetical protein n=1 Tax=Conexibacter sp. SYSU D00693 TaxID=2812560 RepID=UPI00196B3D4A|nr:hypothetical protein [Conexibacter sp. SYSU D00693]
MIGSSVTEGIDTAQAAREHLQVLESERALAGLCGLDHDPMYMADLRQEIADVRSTLVGLAVTEIASLRAQLGGRLDG